MPNQSDGFPEFAEFTAEMELPLRIQKSQFFHPPVSKQALN